MEQFVLIILGIIVGIIIGFAVQPSPIQKIKLTESDDGSDIEVNLGDELILNLIEDPSKDMKWHLMPNSFVKLFREDGETKRTVSETKQYRKFHLQVLDSGPIVFNLTNPYTNNGSVDTVKLTLYCR